jgi:hypothetical protein
MKFSASHRLREARSRTVRGIDMAEEINACAAIRFSQGTAPLYPAMTAPSAPAPETPIWSGSPSQWLNFGTFVLCGLTAAAFIVGARIWAENRLMLLALIPAAIAFWSWLTVRCTRVTVTTERITTQVGIFSRRRWDMELYRVKDTTLDEPFLLRLVGRSNIQVLSSDRSTPDMVVRAVSDGESLRQQIRTHVERMRDLRRVRELDFDT